MTYRGVKEKLMSTQEENTTASSSTKSTTPEKQKTTLSSSSSDDEEEEEEEETDEVEMEPVEYYDADAFPNDEYHVHHKRPRCGYRKCRQELQYIETCKAVAALNGCFYDELGVFLHYDCYDELKSEQADVRQKREKRIVADMERALLTRKVLSCDTYALFNYQDRHYCLYCQGHVNDRWRGVSYPCSDPTVVVSERGYAYIHVECYNGIRRQSEFNPVADYVAPEKRKIETLTGGVTSSAYISRKQRKLHDSDSIKSRVDDITV